jgi:hypothetical protein
MLLQGEVSGESNFVFLSGESQLFTLILLNPRGFLNLLGEFSGEQ